ncbi:putative multi-domain containing protein [Aduncisulcus paluster]|uniref:DNA primase n=1 Tax=Aduncisulcus paluster TaxID=2918883 RepID=A0ABQ5KSE4_9EUKA|nr:putative multi-domain containing protein [Aduncisulcus paluster]
MYDFKGGKILYEINDWMDGRDVVIHLPKKVLKLDGVSREIAFRSEKPMKDFKIVQNVYLKGELIETWEFGHVGFVIPHTMNTWETVVLADKGHVELIEWLQYDEDTDYLHRREICLTLDGDIFVRYRVFESISHASKELTGKRPIKIDIGPVYSIRPDQRLKDADGFRPIERELVFDIDATDFDIVRTCCSKTDMCPRCFRFMTTAAKILEYGLKNYFGFNHLLFVFSGRRGIHCWVCDEAARKLSDRERQSIAGFFNICSDSSASGLSGPKLRAATQHHQVTYSDPIQICTFGGLLWPLFRDYVGVEQGWLLSSHDIAMVGAELSRQAEEDEIEVKSRKKHKEEEEEEQYHAYNYSMFSKESHLSHFLAVLNAPSLSAVLNDADDWKKRISILEGKLRAGSPEECESIFKAIYHFTYPRIDIGVSAHRNHLLKAPFCIHPKTGKVCVPMMPKTFDTFDFESVPQIHRLIGGNQEDIDGFEAYVKQFQKEFLDSFPKKDEDEDE